MSGFCHISTERTQQVPMADCLSNFQELLATQQNWTGGPSLLYQAVLDLVTGSTHNTKPRMITSSITIQKAAVTNFPVSSKKKRAERTFCAQSYTKYVTRVPLSLNTVLSLMFFPCNSTLSQHHWFSTRFWNWSPSLFPEHPSTFQNPDVAISQPFDPFGI